MERKNKVIWLVCSLTGFEAIAKHRILREFNYLLRV
jgi:hypothetical protein